MKTKELIRQLQEADPSGEEEVCVDNIDIYHVSSNHAYWDGCFQVLKHDESKKPYYSITGGEFRSKGIKINLVTVDIKSAIYDHTIDNIPCTVTYDSEYTEKRYKDSVKQWTEEAKKIKEKLDNE
jgi:hypothetical protein